MRHSKADRALKCAHTTTRHCGGGEESCLPDHGAFLIEEFENANENESAPTGMPKRHK